MTSTNDGKEVKSNQASGPKDKTYYIELYKSLDAHLSGDGGLQDRNQHLCSAWRRIHSLCQHSTPKTHLYLRNWLQKHTAKFILRTEWWQSTENRDEHAILTQAIDAFIEDCQTAAESRNGVLLSWEEQLMQRAEWFKKNLSNPWEHPVLRVLLDSQEAQPSDEDVLEWLKEERGVVFVARLRQLAASKCDDLALALATAIMDRVRASTTFLPDAEQCEESKDNPKPVPKSPFAEILKNEADFTKDVWELLIDIEFVLLHKRDKRLRCIDLAKQTPLRNGSQLVKRLENRLETSNREKKKEKLWKNAKEVATLIAQVVIARCMVVANCANMCHVVLKDCARALVRLLPPAKLPSAANALAAPAATATHLHTLAAAVDKESKGEMKPFVCVLYVRAITAGMNELERLKLKTEKETEARSMEQMLASWFVHLGSLLCASDRFNCECILTAFSVHPSPEMYEKIKMAPTLPPIKVDTQDIKGETKSEFGSWANDSRSQTNLVKTSETLNMIQTQHQANVLSTAILAEGEALGLDLDLCQDITVLLSGPRVKTLSWDMDRMLLLENCKSYMERTHGGTRALTTELKFLNLDPSEFQHLPEEEDDENDIYYGIEKGYEHLVEYQEPNIWSDEIKTEDVDFYETALSDSGDSVAPVGRRKKKAGKKPINTLVDELDPLSTDASKKTEKKERPHSKERKPRKKKTVDPLSFDIKEEVKIKLKKEKKEKRVYNKQKDRQKYTAIKTAHVTDSDYDSQGKSSLNSNSEANEDIVYDGLYSHIDDLTAATNVNDERVSLVNEEFSVTKGLVSSSKPGNLAVHSINNRIRTPSVNDTSQIVNKPAINLVSEEVKKGLTRLISERGNLNMTKPIQVQKTERKMPMAIARSTVPIPTQINPKGILIPEMEIPQSFIEKRVDNSAVNTCNTNNRHFLKQVSTKITHDKSLSSTGPIKQPLTATDMIIQKQRTKSANESESQNTFQHFLHELKDKINAGSELPWRKNKEGLHPISRVVPVIPNFNPELRTTTQSAKSISQKKDNNSLNTFSRLSYMHKNKIDKKQHVQSVIERQSNYLEQRPITEQNLDKVLTEHKEAKLKYLYPNLEVSKVCRNYANYNSIVKKEENLLKSSQNPILTNLLQSGSKIKNHPDLRVPCAPPKSSALSEKDQNDLRHLLRQKSKLNGPLLHTSEGNNGPLYKSLPERNNIPAMSNTPVTSLKIGNYNQFYDSVEVKGINSKNNAEVAAHCSKDQCIKIENSNVSNISKNALNTEEDNKPQTEWEEVMNKILAHKTPSRGPTALELTLNKGQRTCESLRNQRIKKNTSKNNSLGEYNNVTIAARQVEFEPKTQLSIVKNPVIANNTILPGDYTIPKGLNPKDLVQPNPHLKQHRVPTIINKPKLSSHMQLQSSKIQNINLSKRIERNETKRLSSEVQKRQFTYTLPKQDDPFISGLPNSDYDLLEELMDDELRKEIGELSDEDFNINANVSKEIKTVKPNTACDSPKIYKSYRFDTRSDNENKFNKQMYTPKPDKIFVVSEPKIVTSETQALVEKAKRIDTSKAFDRHQPHHKIVTSANQPAPEKTERGNSSLSSGISNPPTRQKIVPNVIQPANERVEKKEASGPDEVQGLSEHIKCNKTAAKEYSGVNVIERNNVNASGNSMYVIPQQTVSNILLLGTNVYNTYSTVQTEVSANTISANLYFNQPNISLYHSTQFAAPLVSPLIIGNAISVSTPIVSQVLTTPLTIPNTSEQLFKSSSEPIKPVIIERKVKSAEETCNKSNDTPQDFPKSEKELNYIHSNKSCERKVLSQVQDKDESNDLGKTRNHKLSFENVLKREEQDKERLHNKRMSIINRKNYHGRNNVPIALTYAPLKTAGVCIKANVSSGKFNEDNNFNMRLVSEDKSEMQAEEIDTLLTGRENDQVAIESKENNSNTLCRRILLRSSNKIQTNVPMTVVPKEASGRKTKVRLKLNITDEDNVIDSKVTTTSGHVVKRLNKTHKNRTNKKRALKNKIKGNKDLKSVDDKNIATPKRITADVKPEGVSELKNTCLSENTENFKDELTLLDSNMDNSNKLLEMTTQKLPNMVNTKSNDSYSKKVDKIVIRKVDSNKHEIASINTSASLTNKEGIVKEQDTLQFHKNKPLALPDTNIAELEKTILKIKHLLKPGFIQPTSVLVRKQEESNKIPNIPVLDKEGSNYGTANFDTSQYTKESIKMCDSKKNDASVKIIDSNNLIKDVKTVAAAESKQTKIKTNVAKSTCVDTVKSLFIKNAKIVNVASKKTSFDAIDPIYSKNTTNRYPTRGKVEAKKPLLNDPKTWNEELKTNTSETNELNINQKKTGSVKPKDVKHVDVFKNKELSGFDSVENNQSVNVVTDGLKESDINAMDTDKAAKTKNPIIISHSLKRTVKSINSVTKNEGLKSITAGTKKCVTEQTSDFVTSQKSTSHKVVQDTPSNGNQVAHIDKTGNDKILLKEISAVESTDLQYPIRNKQPNQEIEDKNKDAQKNDTICVNEANNSNDKIDLVNKSKKDTVCNINENDKMSSKSISNDEMVHNLNNIRDQLIIEPVLRPTNDRNLKHFRVKLPNKRTFIASIQGMHVNVDTLFDHPTFKSILLSNTSNSQKYTFNVKQAVTIHNNDPNKVETRIEEVSLANTREPAVIDTINLLSDEEDDPPNNCFLTEFGKFKVNKPINLSDFTKHQTRFNQKCYVNLISSIQRKPNKKRLKSVDSTPEVTSNEHNKNDTKTKTESVVPNVIELDDSSNDSVNLVTHLKDDTNTFKDSLKHVRYNRTCDPVKSPDEIFAKRPVEVKECSVRLINCDNLLKNYKQNRSLNKEFSTDLNCYENYESDGTNEIEQSSSLESDDLHNTVRENFDKDEMCVLSRSGSFSILNDFSLYEIDITIPVKIVDTVKLDRSSPVMEVYDLMAALCKQKAVENKETIRSQDLCYIRCDSELYETKSKLRELFINITISCREVRENSKPCENNLLLLKKETTFIVPSLVSLVVSFFQTHDIHYSRSSIASKENLFKRPFTLKRKFTANGNFTTNKVAKTSLVIKDYQNHNIIEDTFPKNNFVFTSIESFNDPYPANEIEISTKKLNEIGDKVKVMCENLEDVISISKENENNIFCTTEIIKPVHKRSMTIVNKNCQESEKPTVISESNTFNIDRVETSMPDIKVTSEQMLDCTANNHNKNFLDATEKSEEYTEYSKNYSQGVNSVFIENGFKLNSKINTNMNPSIEADNTTFRSEENVSHYGDEDMNNISTSEEYNKTNEVIQKEITVETEYSKEPNFVNIHNSLVTQGKLKMDLSKNTLKIKSGSNGVNEIIEKSREDVLQKINDQLLQSDNDKAISVEIKNINTESPKICTQQCFEIENFAVKEYSKPKYEEITRSDKDIMCKHIVESNHNTNISVKEEIYKEKNIIHDLIHDNISDIRSTFKTNENVSNNPTVYSNNIENIAIDRKYVSFSADKTSLDRKRNLSSSIHDSTECGSFITTQEMHNIINDNDIHLIENIVCMNNCKLKYEINETIEGIKSASSTVCTRNSEISGTENVISIKESTLCDAKNTVQADKIEVNDQADNKNQCKGTMSNGSESPYDDSKYETPSSPSILLDSQENSFNEYFKINEEDKNRTLTIEKEPVSFSPRFLEKKPEKSKLEFDYDKISQDSMQTTKSDFEINDSYTVTPDNEDLGISFVSQVVEDYSNKLEKECELKGIEYHDPELGTCYVFNVAESVSSDDETSEVTKESSEVLNMSTADIAEDSKESSAVLNISTADIAEDSKESSAVLNISTADIAEDSKESSEFTVDYHDYDFNLNVSYPIISTYSRKSLHQQIHLNYDNNVSRALKRKFNSSDIRGERKYRKGKNIDYPKFTADAISESAYGKQYKRIIDYSNSIKFSYSRPFHKEQIDVPAILKNWPIKGPVNMDVPDIKPDNTLFIDIEDICNPKIIVDPTLITLAEEINTEYKDVKINCCEIKETNFSMGFGEESGRVIKNLEDGGDVSKFSAATLSDVKQTQPFLQSEDCEKNRRSTSRLDQINLLKKCVSYINLKEKVRAFFKKTTIDLNQTWFNECKKNELNYKSHLCYFPYDLNSTEFFEPTIKDFTVNVVQVGQLPVSAAAQNPVTCDPRVTQVSDASPSQCSAEHTSGDDPQSAIKTEYTELTTADLSLPLQDFSQHDRSDTSEMQEVSNIQATNENIPIETEIKSIVKIELIEELPEDKEESSEATENSESIPEKQDINNIDYSFETSNVTPPDDSNFQMIFNSTEKQNVTEIMSQQKQQNGSSEKSDQIAHAMNAAGITTTADTLSNTRAHALVNILSQKIRQGAVNVATSQASTFSKSSINAMALQQALAQILPPPLNQTNSESGQQLANSSVTPQVLHIVQGKNSTGNQITLVDNSQQAVLNSSNTAPVLHIVQNKTVSAGPTSTTTATAQTNTFSGLSLVDAGLQQGGNQLLHIVNTGNQKTNNAGQLLKRVNLLTNLANVQGSNEQKMVQFVCKSADGKAIQLNAPHQRSMVLRLQPIETPNIQANVQKPIETHDINSNSTTTVAGKETVTSQQEIKSRSVYEENYAKFIQNSSTKPIASEKATSLPKFNQAFGKQVFQDGTQKSEINNGSNTHIPTAATNSENPECQPTDNAINIEHMNQISSPPLLLRKTTAPTSQAQSNLIQQIKQTIAPMNIQTMHGGVIYTRQIPVNIGGGQTINLITVPSTELIDENIQKQQSDVKFVSQGEIEPSIIKIVPQSQPSANGETSQDENSSHLGVSSENAHTPQPQPVLTQMRIKLPMLSKTPQMVSGARVVRPSFFQIQRNVIGGANQPVYQQLVLTAAPQLGQQTIRLPQAQTRNHIKVPNDTQSSAESHMSSSTLEQLREFDLVLEQVKERSTVQPSSSSSSAFSKLHTTSSDTTDGSASVSSTSTESTQQVLYSIGNSQPMNVAYVNRKETVTTPTTSTFVRSPDSSGIADSPTSSSHVPTSHTVTAESSTSETPTQAKPAKVSSKSKSRPKSSSNPPNTLKLNTVPPKTSTQKPLEDEQTTQRILYILAEYKEQVENSPDKDKPAPRRRSNPPSNPSGSSKRKKSSSGSRRPGRDMSPIHGDDTCRTMGSEDSSCGTSQGDCNESCLDSHSPQDSPRKVVRKLTFEHETPVVQPRPQPQRNVIVADGQTITVARGATGKPTTAVLMPANYILPVSMVKGGQQIAIVTNRGPKLLTVGGGEGGTTNALLLQRLIGPAGLKPVLARPGVRHVRLPTAALHNLQAFNLTTATTIQPPDSTASPAPAPTPPELVESRAASSPWTDRESQDVKPERGSSPEGSEPWNLPSSADTHEYHYEESVPADSMNRTVLVVQKKDGPSHRQQRLTHVSAAALRHKYAILEHELRLQKSLSEECEDLGVDSPSASELFPEAELLFAASPAHDHTQDQAIHSHTPQPTLLTQSSIPQPDLDDQIATDQLLPRADDLQDRHDLNLGLEDVGIVTVSEDGMQATIALDQEEFARSHPNTTFHSEPTDDGEVQPFTLSSLKSRHITSTIFHSNRAPSTVLMTAPQTTVISQATGESSGVQNTVKYSDIDNMINSLPTSHGNSINLSSVLVKDDGLTRFDSILNDSRELHLSNTASAIVHSAGNATQVIRRVCYDDDKRDTRFLMDEPDVLIAGDDAKMIAEDSSREALESIAGDVDDDRSSPERHAELFWESNSASERSESRRPLDFSSDSDKCCKSPSFDETNSTDSSGVGTHMRLDSVIKEARGIERSASADGSSADDTHPPLRTYPPKRMYHALEGEIERSMSGKTRAGERSPDSLEVRRRASGRGVVKRGCHCCNGSPAPPRPKKSRQRKPPMDFSANN